MSISYVISRLRKFLNFISFFNSSRKKSFKFSTKLEFSSLTKLLVKTMSTAEETFNAAEVEQTLASAVENVEEFIAEAEAEAELEAVVDAVEKELQEEEEEQEEQAEEEEEEEEEESDYDDEDDFDPNETVLERIVALKEILTPHQRDFILSSVSSTSNGVKALTGKFGSGLWYLTTTGLLLGVPLAIAIFGETQLMELEKELGGMQAQAQAPPAEAK